MPEILVKYSCRAQACNFIKKESLVQVFSCEYCEISKNTFVYRIPLVVGSVFLKKFFFISNLVAKD